MKEHFLTYEQSLAVKELGFDEPCLAVIDQIQSLHIKGTKRPPRGSMLYDEISCPLKSQFFKWVREKYGYGIQSDTWINGGVKKFRFDIMYPKIYVLQIFDTYEEAENACIDKIIEILKLK